MVWANRRGFVAAVFLALPMQAVAQTEAGEFDLLVRGIKAAVVSYTGQTEGRTYSVQGSVQTTGFAALIKRLRYSGAVNGTLTEGRHHPAAYSESADTGRRQSDATLTYSKGMPQVVSYSPKDETTPDVVDPATMAGTVDPLTALFATLRPVNAGEECNMSINLFDGRRASTLEIGGATAAGTTVTCNGAYIRLKGFTAKEMAKQPRFPFKLTYAPMPTGQMQVVEVISETIYGKVTLKRR